MTKTKQKPIPKADPNGLKQDDRLIFTEFQIEWIVNKIVVIAERDRKQGYQKGYNDALKGYKLQAKNDNN